MKEKIKAYVLKTLKDCEEYATTPNEVYNFRARAFGVVMFALGEDSIETEGLCEWWDNEIWIKFQEIANKLMGGVRYDNI